MTIACVIPSTCSKKILPHLTRCILSLRAAAKGGVQLRIVVVTQNTHPILTHIKQGLHKIVVVDKGAGFAEMNNRGIDQTIRNLKADYHVLINDDAWVEPNFFTIFTNIIKKNKPDFIAPLIYVSDSPALDSFGVEYFTSGYAKNSISLDTPTTLATAACVCIKTSFLRKLKRSFGFIFNPLLWYYLEDVELSIRAVTLGAKIQKNSSLVVHHIGSMTSGRKSYFTMYQTYRNILWVIILTWPLSTILSHFFKILLVQGWVILYSTIRFGPLLYVRLWIDTIKNSRSLFFNRQRILSAYPKRLDFEKIFSRYAFRTYHGVTI